MTHWVIIPVEVTDPLSNQSFGQVDIISLRSFLCQALGLAEMGSMTQFRAKSVFPRENNQSNQFNWIESIVNLFYIHVSFLEYFA